MKVAQVAIIGATLTAGIIGSGEHASAHSKDVVVYATGEKRIVTADVVRVHLSPDLESPVVDRFKQGKTVTILESHGEWTEVERDDKEIGFVKSSYLAAVPATQVHKDLPKGYTTTALRLRQTGSLHAPVITVLTEGTEVSVLSRDNGWVKVTVDGKTGYVAETYLSETPNTQQVFRTGVVQVNVLKVHPVASVTSPAIGYVFHGQQVTILSEKDGWYEIEYCGTGKAWVSKTYVKAQ